MLAVQHAPEGVLGNATGSMATPGLVRAEPFEAIELRVAQLLGDDAA